MKFVLDIFKKHKNFKMLEPVPQGLRNSCKITETALESRADWGPPTSDINDYTSVHTNKNACHTLQVVTDKIADSGRSSLKEDACLNNKQDLTPKLEYAHEIRKTHKFEECSINVTLEAYNRVTVSQCVSK